MINLTGLWSMKCTKDTQWQDAVVPGSVYSDLLRNGSMKDPFFGENEYEICKLSENDYEYTRTFTVDATDLDYQKLVLSCEGLDTLAEIRINGTLIGKTNNMHRTYRFDIKSLLQRGENTIHILFRSPLQFVRKADEKKPLWGVSSTVPGYQHIRKAHHMFGWDWGPKLPDLGIFRNIYIEKVQDVRVKDFYVTQEHKDGSVTLNIDIENEFVAASITEDIVNSCTEGNTHSNNHSNTDKSFTETLTIRDDRQNIIWEGSVELKAGDKSGINRDDFTTSMACTIDEPKLWWPNGYGEQPLYIVTVTISKEGTEISRKEKRIGLRTLTMKRKKDRYGETFGFEINGVMIFAKGANYIPEDNLYGRTSCEKTRKLLNTCIAANFNCIRVWGGGNYGESYFYDICDELGLIVWQDFMFACAAYDLTEEFEANIKAEFEDNIRRLRNHASLGMWCGNNEMESAWLYWGLPENEKLHQDYLTMFERIIPEAVSRFDPETFYWPSSPSSGGGFYKTCEEGYGDAHYWDVWHGKKPFEDFENLYFRFASEYGFQSAPCMKTIRTFAKDEDLNMFSNVMENHQKCIDNGHGNVTLMTYLHSYYQMPKDFATTLYTTQILQADCLEIAISHFRSHRGRCLGSTYWQLNDCNPVVSWSTIDYFGRWKAAHYVVKRCYAPTVINMRKDEKELIFYVSTECRESADYTFSYQIVHQKKGVLTADDIEISVAPLSAKEICRVTVPEMELEDIRNCYVVYELKKNGAEAASRTGLLVKPKQFAFRNPEIIANWSENKAAYELTLSAKEYARRVCIEFANVDVVLSDNCFDLLPGVAKTVTIAKSVLPDGVGLKVLQKELELMSCYHITK